MEEKIINLLKNHRKSYSAIEIADYLNMNDTEGLKEVQSVLRDMERNYKLHVTKKENYIHFKHTDMRVGTLVVKPQGYGFLDAAGDEKIFIPPGKMSNAIDGDTVLAEITSRDGHGTEAVVKKFISRDSNLIVGEFYFEKGKGRIVPENPAIKIKVEIDSKKTNGATNGHKVRIRLLGKPNSDGVYKAEVEKVIGHRDEPSIDILTVIYRYGMEAEFPKSIDKELDKVPNEVEEVNLENRKDLRDKKIFTIDGKDAKDLDDGISIEYLDNGNVLLGVHIADVSHYVEEGSHIDKEGYRRATSVYLTDRVVPMLPQKLSNGICSLNEKVDRLTMTCEMEFDPNGKIVSENIYQSIINSKKRMNYEDVNKIIEKDEVPEGYEDFVDELKDMHKLSKKLRKIKEQRGSLDFDLDEPYIIVDGDGLPLDIKSRERGEAEKLIEDFMVVANETVATFIENMKYPFIYRVHGEPREEKVQDFLKFVSILGYKVDGKVKEIHPKAMQKILDSLSDKKEFMIFSRLLLRSMQKAEYSPINIGHFGLASDCYTHFTSPIRRYPDLTVHRLIKKSLVEYDFEVSSIDRLNKILPELAEHTSERERNAINCEREVLDMKKAEYMESHIGEHFNGMVTSVQSFGMFIELDNQVEGLIKLDEMNNGSKEKFYFDEATFSIKSELNPRGYRLGDDVEIIVKSASKKDRKVEFVLAELTKEEVKVK